jgi:hypothetical protein
MYFNRYMAVVLFVSDVLAPASVLAVSPGSKKINESWMLRTACVALPASSRYGKGARHVT